MRKSLLVLVGVLAAGVLLYRATLAQAGFECEACMAYEGRQTCRTVAGTTRGDAERRAIAGACAVLTSGVTSTLRCERGAPRSLRCQAR